MTILALLLLANGTTPEAVLDRYAAFRRENPALAVDWSFEAGGKVITSGTLKLDGNRRLLFKAPDPQYTYTLSETELGLDELVANKSTYDEYGGLKHVAMVESRVSGAPGFLPSVLISSALRKPGPPAATGRKFTYDGQVTVGSIQTDAVSWDETGQMGTTHFVICIDAIGKIIKFQHSVPNPMGGERMPSPRPRKADVTGPDGADSSKDVIAWTFSHYTRIAHPQLSDFRVTIPKGYVPHALPTSSEISLEVDQSFPSVPWMSHGRSVNLASQMSGRPGLVMITQPQCNPSRAALKQALNLSKAMASAGGSFAVASLSRSASGADGHLYDATGKAAAAIGSTATPLFVLVNSSGKITNLWTGFDAGHSTQFIHEIELAVTKQGKK